MSRNRWVLTDVSNRVHIDKVDLGPAELGDSFGGCHIQKQTLHGGLANGIDVIDVDAGSCQLTLLPTRGMAIWKAHVGEVKLGWKSPLVGPVHPSFVPVDEPSGLGFLCGFDEFLTRCGLYSNGAPEFDDQGNVKSPLHGWVGNRPAHRVEVSTDTQSGEMVIEGEVDDSRFHLWKLRLISTLRVRPGEAGFRVTDRIVNLSNGPQTAQLLYHVNYGAPLLEQGSRLIAPIQTMAPRDARAVEDLEHWNLYKAPDPNYTEQCYFFDLAAGGDNYTQVMLCNADANRGVGMRFRKDQFPCFTQWKNTVGEGDGYVTGLEPATNFPNARSFEAERGRVLNLPPHGSSEFELEFRGLASAAEVRTTADQIADLQKTVEPTIHSQPVVDWCGAPPSFDE